MIFRRTFQVVLVALVMIPMTACRSLQPQQGRPAVSRSESRPPTPPSIDFQRKLDPKEGELSADARRVDQAADQLLQARGNIGNQAPFFPGNLNDQQFVDSPNGLFDPQSSSALSLPEGLLTGNAVQSVNGAGVINPNVSSCGAGGCGGRVRTVNGATHGAVNNAQNALIQ